MHKILRLILLGRRLQEQLRITIDRIVQEHDRLRQLAIVEQLARVRVQMQMGRLVLESKLILIRGTEAEQGAYGQVVQGLVKQINSAQLPAEQIHFFGGVWRAAYETLVEYFRAVNVEGHLHERQLYAVHVADDLTLAPAVVDVRDGDHVPLARLELVLDAVLHVFAVGLCLVTEYEAGAHEVGRVADAFAGAEPVKVGLLLLDVDAAHRVDSEPCGECEAVLVRPIADWRKGYAL